MNRARIGCLASSLALLVAGCSSPPDEQMSLAQKAMDQAKEQHAAEFAPTEWRNAESAWQQARSLYDKQGYGEAGTLFVTAKSRYEKARNVAKSKRDAVLRDVQGLEKTIDLRYKTLKTGIENSRARLSAARQKSLDETCKSLDTAIERLKTEIEQGEYTAAKTTAQTTVRMVYEGEKELDGYVSGKKRTT